MARIIKFYHRWNWAISVGGYLIMLSTIISGLYMGFCFIETANATAITVADLQTWKGNVDVNFARIGQEVHDLHEYIMPRRMKP